MNEQRHDCPLRRAVQIWAKLRKREWAAAKEYGRVEAAMLSADSRDPSLKTALECAYSEWVRANEALIEAEQALAAEVES